MFMDVSEQLTAIPEYEGKRLRNVGHCFPVNMAPHSKRHDAYYHHYMNQNVIWYQHGKRYKHLQ
jgi:hypothetical protein